MNKKYKIFSILSYKNTELKKPHILNMQYGEEYELSQLISIIRTENKCYHQNINPASYY